MNEIIINVVCSIFCVVLGVSLDRIFQKRSEKPKLHFSLQSADEINNEYGTKYSPSGYQIEITNVSEKPYLLTQISLLNENKVMVDCFVDNEILQPFGCCIYELSNQEYNAIKWHCKKTGIQKCTVVAYDKTDKRVKGELDLFLPYMQSQI